VFYRSMTLLKGHTTPPAFRWPQKARSPSLAETRLRARRYVHLPDWLLHLLYIRPVDRRRIQPSYCFRGATTTHRQRPTLLQLVLGQRTAGGPFTLMPAHGRSISLSHTHALLLPLLHHLLATRCREAISDFTYPPFLRLGLTDFSEASQNVFSEGVCYYPCQGSEATTATLFKGADGRSSSDDLRLSLLGWS